MASETYVNVGGIAGVVVATIAVVWFLHKYATPAGFAVVGVGPVAAVYQSSNKSWTLI